MLKFCGLKRPYFAEFWQPPRLCDLGGQKKIVQNYSVCEGGQFEYLFALKIQFLIFVTLAASEPLRPMEAISDRPHHHDTTQICSRIPKKPKKPEFEKNFRFQKFTSGVVPSSEIFFFARGPVLRSVFLLFITFPPSPNYHHGSQCPHFRSWTPLFQMPSLLKHFYQKVPCSQTSKHKTLQSNIPLLFLLLHLQICQWLGQPSLQYSLKYHLHLPQHYLQKKIQNNPKTPRPCQKKPSFYQSHQMPLQKNKQNS